ncbi:MAG: SLC13 family permease [Myxococcota bacterium]
MWDVQAVVVCAVTLGVLVALVLSDAAADVVLFGGLGALVLAGVLDVKTALAGFANEGTFTVGLLFVVAAGVRQTGAVHRLSGLLLGHPDRPRLTLARMAGPVALASAVLNNTPIVAALLPVVTAWCRRHGRPASQLLLPLSYATILGGTVTAVGTSTNLVVTGLVHRNVGAVPGLREIHIFDITAVGLPVAVVGCALLVAAAPWLFPRRQPPVSTADDPREYVAEFLVQPRGPLVGRPAEAVFDVPGAFLLELHRDGAPLAAIDPRLPLAAGDRLVFGAQRDAVLELERVGGLVVAPTRVFSLRASPQRTLVEAVVGPANQALGRSLREARFRNRYRAVVIGIARHARRIEGRLGEVVLELGDVLLLETEPAWAEAHRDSQDFYLVSDVPDSSAFRHERAPVAALILVAMVVAAATGTLDMFRAALIAAAALLLTGCLTLVDARRAIEWSVLVSIASAFGIGEAFRVTGIDQALAQAVTGVAHTPYAGLVALYLATAVLTELVTNNAAAALMFPFALSLAAQIGCSPMPYVIAVMFAASASFSTPIGYQTNLMVQGPGGYRFSDYLRAGIPLQIAAGATTLAAIPWVFPF